MSYGNRFKHEKKCEKMHQSSQQTAPGRTAQDASFPVLSSEPGAGCLFDGY